MIIRLKKNALLSIAMFIITAGMALSATRYVPNNFSSIQAAISASATGDEIVVTDNLSNEPAFTVPANKNLTIRGSDMDNFWQVFITPSIKIQANVTIMCLSFINNDKTKDLIQISAGGYAFISACNLNGMDGGSASLIKSSSSNGIVVIGGQMHGSGYGINSTNDASVACGGVLMNGVWHGISFVTTSTSSSPYLSYYSGTIENRGYTGSSNCIYTSFPNSSGHNSVTLGNTTFHYSPEQGQGNVPIKFYKKANATITANTFQYCPLGGAAWTKQSSDIVSDEGNTYPTGSGCSAGPH